LHILDNNTNVVRVEVGPQTYRCKDQETAVYGPTKMIFIPPRHYVIIANPVMVDQRGKVVFDNYNQAVLRHGDQEVRLEREPFPLFPGEILVEKVYPLQVIEINSALRLQAIRDFKDRYDEEGQSKYRTAGSEWLIEGPKTYTPQPEVKVINSVVATLIEPETALRLTTSVDFRDRTGTFRIAGSQWHYNKEGVFIPEVNERILSVDKAYILTDKVSLHLRAQHRFTDAYGNIRPAGTEWLITSDITTSHIPHVLETVVGTVPITTVNKREWVVIQNPVENGRPQYGKKKILRAENGNFFLQPGEKLVSTNSVQVLTADKALLLQAVKPFDEMTELGTIHRKAGEQWILPGPREYWPPLEVKVKETLPAILQLGSTSIFRLDTILYGVFGILVTLYIFWKLISSLFF